MVHPGFKCEDGKRFMLFRGQLANLIVLVNPELCRECVRYPSTGQAQLYIHVTKALYGLLESAV